MALQATMLHIHHQFILRSLSTLPLTGHRLLAQVEQLGYGFGSFERSAAFDTGQMGGREDRQERRAAGRRDARRGSVGARNHSATDNPLRREDLLA